MAMDLIARRQEALRLGFDGSKIREKFPGQIIRFVILMVLSLLGTRFILVSDSVFLSVLMSLGLGLVYASLGMFTHDFLHGTIWEPRSVLGKAISKAMSFFGMFILGLSPELWKVWHNRVHHYRTNEPGADPDSFGLWSEFQKLPMNELILKRAPGNPHWLAWIYLPLNFSNQAMTVTWYFLFSSKDPAFKKANRSWILGETFLIYAIWIATFLYFGFAVGFLVLMLPSMIANLILSAYILTQHTICPLTDSNDPLENTLGVSTHPVIEAIHFNFSHHVEHHYFPEMNAHHYPELRALLMKNFPNDYRILPLWKAVHLLLTTPRVYLDHHTLYDPKTGLKKNVVQTGRTQPQS